MCTSPWRYFQNLFMGLGTGMVSCLDVDYERMNCFIFSRLTRSTITFTANTRRRFRNPMSDLKQNLTITTLDRATAWQNTKRNNKRQISNIWINLKKCQLSRVELNRDIFGSGSRGWFCNRGFSGGTLWNDGLLGRDVIFLTKLVNEQTTKNIYLWPEHYFRLQYNNLDCVGAISV